MLGEVWVRVKFERMSRGVVDAALFLRRVIFCQCARGGVSDSGSILFLNLLSNQEKIGLSFVDSGLDFVSKNENGR